MALTGVWGSGYYYGTTLSMDAIRENVRTITYFFRAKGWKDYPIAAMVGNIQYEGELNPGQWEHGKTIEQWPPDGVGFGLVQWTPWTKFSTWAQNYGDWRRNYNLQLERIQYECDHAAEVQQWVPRHGYTLSFYEFTQSNSTDIDWLTMAWFWCYEYGTPLEAQRKAAARQWLEFIQSLPPGPGPEPLTKKGMPLWMFLKPFYKRRF